ncbi:transcriptional regulator [Haloarcula sp. CBA1131]|jgi:ZIP family zinc transporter|uniref:Divalent heavy-metal cations transporter n=1 Tax=Haloarcula marismortui ATCC 33799 TaxID=662475 RepID=M0K247_9EURY|nr:divalent heavy-metal cations transporter [Haloarcula californiae]EMA14863.1 divalent heavy-metal cations transporter [Haloarcula californiae ATCC 33799]KAA9401073.1 transcriptional regulator [Haloarcula sp. CBA1131]
MILVSHIGLVFVAGLVTAVATGLGAIPFFFIDEFSDRWNVALWGIASGIMVAASLFGLIGEGLQYTAGGLPTLMIGGLLTGVALVEVSDRLLDRIDLGTDDHPVSNHGDAPQGKGADPKDPDTTQSGRVSLASTRFNSGRSVRSMVR